MAELEKLGINLENNAPALEADDLGYFAQDQKPIPTYSYSKEEFDNIFNVLSEASAENPSLGSGSDMFAKELVKLIQANYPENPEYASYDNIANMTAPILDNIPKFNLIREAKAAQNRSRLSSNDIISLFSRTLDGEPILAPSQQEGFVRGVKKSATGNILSSGAFYGGVKAGNLALSGIPPVTFPTAALRLLGPLAVGTFASVVGKEFGDAASDFVIGEGDPFIPGTSETGERAGELTTAMAAFSPIGFLTSPTTNLGVEAAKTIAKEAGKKIPISTKITGYLEKMLRQSGADYRTSPLKYGLIEAGIGTATVAGGTAAFDAGMGAAGQLGIEVSSGIGGGVLANSLFKRAPAFFSSIAPAFRNVRKEGFKEATKQVFTKAGDARENQIANYILDVIEEYGEDPKEIIERLASDDFVTILNAAGKDEAQDILDEFGDPIKLKLTASMKAQSIALLALERSMDTAGVLGRERKAANQQAQRALRHTIVALFAQGNPTSTRMAAELMETQFTSTMENSLKNGANTLVKAFEKVKGKDRATDELGIKLQGFFDNKLKLFRNEEDKLWREANNSVGGLNLSDFTGGMREGDNAPGFIKFWRSRVNRVTPNSPDFKEVNELNLRGGSDSVDKFVNRIEKAIADSITIDKKTGLPKGEPVVISFDELIAMRRSAQGEARRLSSGANPDLATSNLLNDFAESINQDLLAGFPEGQNVAFDTARAYTKSLADAVNRTFVGKAFRTTGTGGDVVAPETLIETLFSGDMAFLKARQVEALADFELSNSLTTTLDKTLQGQGQDLLNSIKAYATRKSSGTLDMGLVRQFVDQNAALFEEFPEAAKAVNNAIRTSKTSRGLMEAGLRQIRSQVFDPITGEFNQKSLDTWLNKNSSKLLLQQFPNLKKDLNDATTAKFLLDETTDLWKEKSKKLNQEISFRDLLLNGAKGTESPKTAFARALAGGNLKPTQSLDNLWEVIKNAPDNWVGSQLNESGKLVPVKQTKDDAKEGFKTSLIQHILSDGGAHQDNFSPRRVFEKLFNTLPNSQVSLEDWMLKNDVMSKNELSNMKKFLTKMVEVETFATTGGTADELEGLATRVGPAIDFYLRVAGSQAGANLQRLLPGGGGGQSLVAASAGSKAIRSAYKQVFASIPDSLKADAMEKMFSDPKYLADILRKARTEKDAITVANKILNSLIKDGLAVPRRALPPAIDYLAGGEDSKFKNAVDYLIEKTAIIGPAESAELPIEDRILETVPETNAFGREIIKPPSYVDPKVLELYNQQSSVQTQPLPTPTEVSANLPRPGLNVNAGGPPVSNKPVDRARFASLFPEDRALIEGIGSLV